MTHFGGESREGNRRVGRDKTATWLLWPFHLLLIESTQYAKMPYLGILFSNITLLFTGLQ
jgi:hypothetical protein